MLAHQVLHIGMLKIRLLLQAEKRTPWDKEVCTNSCFAFTLQACCKRGGWGGFSPPQFFAKQLTLSQPRGQIMPTKIEQAPPDFQTLRRP